MVGLDGSTMLVKSSNHGQRLSFNLRSDPDLHSSLMGMLLSEQLPDSC